MAPKVKTKPDGDVGTAHTHSPMVTSGITPSPATVPAAPAVPAYYIQHTPISIPAAKLDTRSFEVLDHSKNNWSNWSFSMKLVLNQHIVGGYLLGVVTAPDPLLEPGVFNNWMLNTIAIISALCSHVTHEDQHLLEDITNAKAAWDALHEHHEKVGPIAQILLIQEVFVKRYSRGQRFSLTSSKLSELVRHIYHISIPTEEVFLSFAMLNALSGKLSTVQTQIASLLSLSSKDRPFTSADIRTRLDTEQQLLDNEKARSMDLVLVATSSCPKHHGSARVILWCAVPPTVCYDNSGHAYLVDSVTGGAVFLTSVPIPPATQVPPPSSTVSGTSEFAGLAHDSVLPAFLHTLSTSDQFEFDAFMAHIGDLTTSVNWHRHSAPFDFANLSVTAPDQYASTVINLSVEPFFINTGASVHISNTSSDFYCLHPIPPRVINGIGGSGICTVGIGNIHLAVS
ncbi:hypothetical protein BS17DRAFT_770553 [Gyrodon lividus]|nr:hypothetical protein BS17DRAFT_770553 [Gyrodon lividus]